MHGFDKRRILALRITHQDIILRAGKCQKDNQELGEEALTRSGYAQQEHGLIQKVCQIAEDHIVRDGIFSEIDTAYLLDLLYLEGHKYRKTFRCQSTQSIDFPNADRQCCIQRVELLIFHRSKLTQMFSCR